jgi:cytochrome c oxidase subunit III
VREGTTDWGHLALPSVLYLNTLVLLASSAALEFSRRSLAPARLIEPGSARKSSAWLLLALFLGLAFCVGQYSAWQQLRTQGVYLASNPSSSFFYVLVTILLGLALCSAGLGLIYFMHLAEERRGLFLSLIPATIFVLLMRNMIWSDSFRLLRMDSFPQ